MMEEIYSTPSADMFSNMLLDSSSMSDPWNVTSDEDGDNVTNTTLPDPFWTEDQLLLIASIPSSIHVVLGMIVSLIGFLGIICNALVLYVFSRFKRLRNTPANTFIINLALADFCAGCFHPMAAYSNFQGRWSFGHVGCQLYGMFVCFFGLVSIMTFSAIAFERCIVITSKPLGAKWKVTRSRAKKACVFIWLHCAALVLPPLFGWSAYIPEGLLTTCSWDYRDRSASNRSYYIILLLFGFVLPVVVICACYMTILISVLSHGKEMIYLAVAAQKGSFKKLKRQTDIRTAQIVITLIMIYMVSWTPYAIVTAIGQFGPEDMIGPFATVIPAHFAKGAIVWDPIVYGFSHPHFRQTLRHCMAGTPQSEVDNSGINMASNVGASVRDHSIYHSRNFSNSYQRTSSHANRRLPTFRTREPAIRTQRHISTNIDKSLTDRCSRNSIGASSVVVNPRHDIIVSQCAKSTKRPPIGRSVSSESAAQA